MYKVFIVSGKVCRNREDIIVAWKVAIPACNGFHNNSGSHCNRVSWLLKLYTASWRGNRGNYGCMLQSTIQFGIASCTKVYPKPLYRSEISILKPIYAIYYRAAVCKHCLMEKKKKPKALGHEIEIQRKT